MHNYLLNLSDDQYEKLKDIKKKKDIDISVQIRNAIDKYLLDQKE